MTWTGIALLHSDGYSDPGRAPNYWRLYDMGEFDDQAIARPLLRILFEVHGYAGTSELAVLTESG